MLFSDAPRSDSSPKGYSESSFTHLDRRAGADHDRIRDLFKSWLSHMSGDERHDLEQRIRSGNDAAFHSAFLEVYVHELLLATGHRVTAHPEMESTPKRPDFLAVDADSSSVVIECTVATEMTVEQRSAQARLNTAYDVINQLSSPDYFLGMDVYGVPNTPVPAKRWTAQIRSWLASMNYEEVLTVGAQERFDELPTIELSHDGLDVLIRPIAKKRSARGKVSSRVIGAQGFEGCIVTSRFEIRETVKQKAGRYGRMNQPFLIVVNCIGEHADHEEIEAAFFGNEGLWSRTGQPVFSRLSAVVATWHLFPWSIARSGIRLYHNPFAAIPYAGPLTRFPQVTRVDGEFERLTGSHPREIFNLPRSWPTA